MHSMRLGMMHRGKVSEIIIASRDARLAAWSSHGSNIMDPQYFAYIFTMHSVWNLAHGLHLILNVRYSKRFANGQPCLSKRTVGITDFYFSSKRTFVYFLLQLESHTQKIRFYIRFLLTLMAFRWCANDLAWKRTNLRRIGGMERNGADEQNVRLSL